MRILYAVLEIVVGKMPLGAYNNAPVYVSWMARWAGPSDQSATQKV
jgi:hypothetical protein